MNGNAVINTDRISSDPSDECDDLPMAAKAVKDIVSIIASNGRSNGV